MTRTSKKGMWLRPMESTQKRNNAWIAHTAAALLAYTAFILAFAQLSGFDRIYPVWGLLAIGFFLCVLHGIALAFRQQGIFYPAVLLLLLLLVLLFRQQIMDGISLVWNRLGDTWTASTGWVLPEWEIRSAETEHNICLLLFSLLAGSMGALGCCVLVSVAAPVLGLLLPGAVLLGMIFLGQPIPGGSVMLVLVTAALLLLYGGWGKQKALPAVLVNWGAFAVIACILAIAMIPALEDWVSDFSRQLHETIHTQKYETKYTTLPEGNFTDYEAADQEAEPALVVTMEQPEAMYLRGFTGAVFDGEVWTAQDGEALARQEDLLYWLHLNAFHPAKQFESAIFGAETENNLVTVQNIGACSRYYYLPFSLSSDDLLQSENLNADCIASNGERIYAFSAVSDGAGMVSRVLEQLQTSEDRAVLDYRKAESAYRNFVYSHYLQIPQEAMDQLGREWAACGDPEKLTAQQAQACVMDFLERCFAEKNAALPLEQAAGSCYQYATVAALTLRYFGIPARYAEGYIITEEMAGEAESGVPIEVDSTCAGAWVEVYQDGIGWMPLDLTTGTDEQGSGNNGSHHENQAVKEGQELEDEPDQPQAEEEPKGGYTTSLPKAIAWGGILMVPVLALLVVLLMIRRKIILDRKEKKFRDGNYSAAVAWIFADTVLLLEKLGFDRGNGSVRDLCGAIRERFGDAYAAQLGSIMDLNDQALFSSRPLTREQQMTALDFREKTLEYLRSEIKWYERLWLKWIECIL